MPVSAAPLLELQNLSTHYVSAQGTRVVRAVDDVSLRIHAGETLGIVGKSGSGKSTLALTILRILPPAARIVGGRMLFEGEDLLERSDSEMRHIRGKRIAMILQDPMASLNPLFTIGDQVGESIRVHDGASRATAWSRAKELAESRADPVARNPRDTIPARNVGRHAPAHRRRHRHLLRAAPVDRRRADHQPRPDDPGAVPQTAARPAAGTQSRADLHHSQSRHRREDVRPAGGDVCRTRRRVGTGVADFQRADAPLHRGAAELDPADDRQCAPADRD